MPQARRDSPESVGTGFFAIHRAGISKQSDAYGMRRTCKGEDCKKGRFREEKLRLLCALFLRNTLFALFAFAFFAL